MTISKSARARGLLGMFVGLASLGVMACEPVPSAPALLEGGVYCLTFDVAVGGQAAFKVGDDAVLDCGRHRITELSATGTAIYVDGTNAVVRNCVVEGFTQSIVVLPGSTYYRITGNTVLSARTKAIVGYGDEGLISGNVISTAGVDGGHEWLVDTHGIADVVGNLIVSAKAPAFSSAGARYGISTSSNAGGIVARNLVRDVLPSSGEQGIGIFAAQGYPVLYRNVLSAVPGRGDIGLFCYGGAAYSTLNTVVGYPNEVGGCMD
jgi:hypothetical protein